MKVKSALISVASALLLFSGAAHSQSSGLITLPGFPLKVREYERNFTCNGGWPGTRDCKWNWAQPSNGFVIATFTTAYRTSGSSGSRVVDVGTSNYNGMYLHLRVNEGDMFNPGKHTASYRVKYYAIPF